MFSLIRFKESSVDLRSIDPGDTVGSLCPGSTLSGDVPGQVCHRFQTMHPSRDLVITRCVVAMTMAHCFQLPVTGEGGVFNILVRSVT